MHKIEYEIDLNETGRPCIKLSENYEDKNEDKFFAFEIARYFIQNTYNKVKETSIFDKETLDIMDISIRLLGQIGDEMAKILWNEMKTMGDLDFILDKTYHIRVNTIEERDNIKEFTCFRSKLYERKVGLKVLVTEMHKSTIYELNSGITNEDWIKINES